MIPKSAETRLQRFTQDAKSLLVKNITDILANRYEIWADGHMSRVGDLPANDADTLHTARMLRERISNLEDALADNVENKTAIAVTQLIAEQAFTVLNRFCALKMCEERGIFNSIIDHAMASGMFQAYDMVTGGGAVGSQYQRYQMFLMSLFDELSIEMPSIFNRYSPYGLVFPDERTLNALLALINADDMAAYYDAASGVTVNFWQEDETIGWLFQYYNSLEERRQMRAESNQPRNSREMAVRNQFFTPEYVVRFLTDNTLGRIWYEMTNGSKAITDYCQYLVYRKDEEIPHRAIKEPTEIRTLDPTCGSMHFGMYAFGVYEVIYMDAWDNHPELLMKYRARRDETGRVVTVSREDFHRLVPKLILENNIYGAEIDPRALQIAALSLWLRAQRSWSEQKVEMSVRPMITRSNLVLCEAMPGNKKMLAELLTGFSHPMQLLIKFIWDKMKYVGEAGLLIKMEDEIDREIEYIRSHWSQVNKQKDLTLDATAEEIEEQRQLAKLSSKEAKEDFFRNLMAKLRTALEQLTQKLSESEGYENVLFAEDALRGLAFIELCNMRFEAIVMNPPFGEGSVNTSAYFDANYPAWCGNLVCAFFDRMQEMLNVDGRLGAIFDRTVMIKSSYENFRKRNLCGFITNCADTGWGVLDANVETSTLVLNKIASEVKGVFIDVHDVPSDEKNNQLRAHIQSFENNDSIKGTRIVKSADFSSLPNSLIGYNFNAQLIKLFKNRTFISRGFDCKKGHDLSANIYPRLFYEIRNIGDFSLMYNGGGFTMFYFPYRDATKFKENIIRADKGCNIRSLHLQKIGLVGFGKRGDILDAHILKRGFIFTREGIGLPNISEQNAYSSLSYLNSIVSQFAINLYCGQHKGNGYVNLLPMPDYTTRQSDIEQIVNNIIAIKRLWFSLDETNLEYHGLISHFDNKENLKDNLGKMQEKLTADYNRYEDLKKQNDNLWMDLADIAPDSDFRNTLNDYKSRRPYEELLSIDGASTNNVINSKVMAEEIVQELMGLAFGRWDIRYTKDKPVPEFGDVFDPLPFMPVVSLKDNDQDGYPLEIPQDGIIKGSDMVALIRKAMEYIWGDKADDIEYELCQLIGTDCLTDYLEYPNGFFAYHFMRYTKSRRKAPIYWPLSSEDESETWWVYYPKLDERTLPNLVLKLTNEITILRADLQRTADKDKASRLNNEMLDLQAMSDELRRIQALPYKPNHDDGVPVTAAPLYTLFKNKKWRTACEDNWKQLDKGDYDWSHLAYAIYPARIRQKAKKDWCMALTHGLEELCENKPKEKKKKTTKNKKVDEPSLF